MVSLAENEFHDFSLKSILFPGYQIVASALTNNLIKFLLN
jgi:hypothetical protein